MWKTTHGQSRTRLYSKWLNMISRCTNPNDTAYHHYGGRGVVVCPAWRASFEAFRDDMGEPPTNKHQLDRYPDNNGNYEPGNVRWATPSENNNNRRNNRLITHDGVTHTAAEWGRLLGMSAGVIIGRLNLGYSTDIAFQPGRIPHKKRGPERK